MRRAHATAGRSIRSAADDERVPLAVPVGMPGRTPIQSAQPQSVPSGSGRFVLRAGCFRLAGVSADHSGCRFEMTVTMSNHPLDRREAVDALMGGSG